MLSLYALTTNPAHRVVRFKLSGELQTELDQLFRCQEKIFNDLAENEIVFDGKYKPDAGEVLKIENYEDIDRLDEAISSPLGIPEIGTAEKHFFEIKALFSGYQKSSSATILIQHFDRRRIISTNGLSFFHANDVFRKIEGSGITLDNKLAAILQDKTLRFLSFYAVKQIFDLSAYYREATDADINDFASLPSIAVTNLPELIGLSDGWVRRKFWLIQQGKLLERVPMQDIKSVAIEFKIPLQTEIQCGVEKIVLPRKKKSELKAILRFLDEDYYKSSLSKTNYITNSKRRVT